MRKSRLSDAQIVGILKENDAGEPAGSLCRRHGISEQTLYRRKRKNDGLEDQDLRRLKSLEEVNAARRSDRPVGIGRLREVPGLV